MIRRAVGLQHVVMVVTGSSVPVPIVPALLGCSMPMAPDRKFKLLMLPRLLLFTSHLPLLSPPPAASVPACALHVSSGI